LSPIGFYRGRADDALTIGTVEREADCLEQMELAAR
jgi:hypothetical protein